MGSDAVFSALADDGGLDLWVLALKVMATGITAALSLLFLVFLASLSKPGRRERRAAWHFSLASLCATLYIAADTAVRAYAVLDAVDDVLLPYRLALSALILSIAAYVALAWSLGPASRRQSTMIGLLYAGAMLAAAVVWIEHPALVIAGPTVAVRGTGVYAHYGLAAGAFFALCLVLFSVMWRRLLPLARAMGGAAIGRLAGVGFAALFVFGVHDVLLELERMPVPVGLLPLAYAGFQMGVYAVLAIQYSRALDQRQRQDLQLRRLSDAIARDTNTGLYTRVYLENRLNELGARASGGLLFVDLDDFKAVNDTQGHAAGDRIIRAVADRIRLNMRDDDIACRWGGDEFVVYLPGVDTDVLRSLAERLREALREICDGSDAQELTVSASMGFAELVDGDWCATLERADRAMYAAKQAGRNRLALAPPPVATSAARRPA